jgi:competence protein ComEC
MASIFFLARWRGRPAEVTTVLALSAALIILITPEIRSDLGFQLSVAATFALGLMFDWTRDSSPWKQAIAVPFVAQLAVSPLLLYRLGTYSSIATLTNLLAAPLVPMAMLGGLVVAILSQISSSAASVAGLVAWMPSYGIMLLVDWSSSFEAGSGMTMNLGWRSLVGIYIVVACVAVLGMVRPDLRRRFLGQHRFP